MNKKVLGCLLVCITMGIRGAGVRASSFMLINGVVKDEVEAEQHPLSVMVTYESHEKAKLTGHTVKRCQTPIALAEAEKVITRMHVTEYNVYSEPIARGHYGFNAEIRNTLSSGSKCLHVTKHGHALVFKIEDLKSAKAVCKAGA